VPRKTAENTVKHRGGGGGSVVANHRGGGEISMVVTTLVWGVANNCTTCENPTLADLAVLSVYISYNKVIIYRFKRGFFVGYV